MRATQRQQFCYLCCSTVKILSGLCVWCTLTVMSRSIEAQNKSTPMYGACMASSCSAGYSNISRPSSPLCPAAHTHCSRWAIEGRHIISIAFTECKIVHNFNDSWMQYVLLGLLQGLNADVDMASLILATGHGQIMTSALVQTELKVQLDVIPLKSPNVNSTRQICANRHDPPVLFWDLTAEHMHKADCKDHHNRSD